MTNKLAKLTICIIPLFLSGCFLDMERNLMAGLSYPPKKIQHVQLSKEYENGLYIAIKDELKDPNSAIISNVKAIKVTDEETPAIYACGFVNAKNSYGGYTGKSPFFAYSIFNKPLFMIISGHSLSPYIMNICEKSHILPF